ncbi:hypothetical protein CDD82_6526 [Ophiocordyceps australis]|uniref:Histone deacetylation protein Rxt3 n=1 Tax=Ophiocordyceps australis TaxID=1399860 RepID=A0A2C5YPG3_9HYPO|nr:hypothetical protein CDD82_6526 [Ophiocordyceps australis]
MYDPGLKPSRLLPSVAATASFCSNPNPLPWDVVKDKENCILTVKVPRIHLAPIARQEITARAYLWGTDVYTDDSDVVAACIHGGWIRGEWNEDFDVAAFFGAENEAPSAMGNKANDDSLGSEKLITSPQSSGPLPIPPCRDLHVDVLILPRLEKYAATTRFGISSREFGGKFGARHSVHDGISYMIHSIRWVKNGAQPQARLRGKARRERMRKAMKEAAESYGMISSADGGRQQGEGEDGRLLSGTIAGNWRKPSPLPEQQTTGEKDKVDEGNKEGRGSRQTSEENKVALVANEAETPADQGTQAAAGEGDRSEQSHTTIA